MKAKKGQILILTLIIMALGLIIISPLLDFINNSYNLYISDLKRTDAYYAADAMVTYVLNDVYKGIDVYENNIISPYSQDGFLGGNYDISVEIEEVEANERLSTPTFSTGWVYMDPGVSSCEAEPCDSSLLLESLAYDATHEFTLYLVGGHDMQVNWASDDEGYRLCDLFGCRGYCAYYLDCSMWMTYSSNGSVVPGTTVSGTATSDMLSLFLEWSVPVGASGNYTINFKNNGCTRQSTQDFFGTCGGSANRPSYSASFVAADVSDHTWVRLGTEESGEVYAYKDYLITTTAERDDRTILTITAYIRHSPGPLAWWKEQTVEIPTWQVTYN